ncbi:RcpC/CpaB family pilus assembly protein [Streptomyces sp. NPDC059037]|uniref:RcpC/CpaB family pilus assembly protein n=1 Tax=Streptomyces sp. NPDC059037 TaxID=3346710 RepID=UPI003698F727
MKIQERTGAGNGRSAAPVQPAVGERLPAPPRERKPALAALAVLLILIGALGATVLVLRAGERIEVVKITNEIPAGESVNDSNVTSVMVAEDSGINYVKWSQVDGLKKLKATNTIPKGAVAVGEMFSSKSGLPAGKSAVGVSLKEGQYPADGLKTGDTVDVYQVGDSASSGSNDKGTGGSAGSGGGTSDSPIVAAARVSSIADKSDATVSTGALGVTLLVDSADAAAVTRAASAGQVSLVQVSPNGN